MKILIVKTSSMGDIIHTLPAISDAATFFPIASFDWVVEEAFSEIPTWHAHINKVIPVAWRQFRKRPLQVLKSGKLQQFLMQLRSHNYDFIIDAQGLIKSAVMTRLARGTRCGLDWSSARERLASLAYQKKVNVNSKQHAITRVRQLFSQALGYPLQKGVPNYGLKFHLAPPAYKQPYLVFIHGTTWRTKEWPQQYWQALIAIATQHDFEVLLPWGSLAEQRRAKWLAEGASKVTMLPRTSLTELAGILQGAAGIVSVDTGLGHLAAALSLPTVSLYGPTNPEEIGTQGLNQSHIAVKFNCSPCWSQQCGYRNAANVTPACFESIPPDLVWTQLMKIISLKHGE